VPDFEGEGRVIRDHRRVGRGNEVRVAVLVLQTFTVERGASGRRADEEPARHLVGCAPQRVGCPLEPEHRVEDIHRDHGFVVRRVRRASSDERRYRSGLVDSLVQQLTVSRFLVRQHEFSID
jgi:hypothetical protein